MISPHVLFIGFVSHLLPSSHSCDHPGVHIMELTRFSVYPTSTIAFYLILVILSTSEIMLYCLFNNRFTTA